MCGEMPPGWFFDIYDSILMNIPVHKAPTISGVSLIARWRYRVVRELISDVNLEKARKTKAMFVFDLSRLI